ncbi:MAG: hypothetical protein KA712_02950 [Myxococcales bacterium]|nr:hypothetical protein [Myxococcales bacterium]
MATGFSVVSMLETPLVVCRLRTIQKLVGPVKAIDYARRRNLGFPRVRILERLLAGVIRAEGHRGACYRQVLLETLLFADSRDRTVKLGLRRGKLGHVWFQGADGGPTQDDGSYDLVLTFSP